MNVLLDTFYLYRFMAAVRGFSDAERRFLDDRAARILVSAVSIWEMRLKFQARYRSGVRKSRFDPDDVVAALEQQDVTFLPLTTLHAARRLAGRLARLDRQCGSEERKRIAEASGGASIGAISHAIVDGLDPDRQVAAAGSMFDVPAGNEPTEQQVERAATTLLKQAAEPIATRPRLRQLLQDIKRKLEQLIDDISVDELIEAGASEEARQKAKSLVDSFERFIADNKDEIDALQFFYGTPYARRLRFSDLKALANEIQGRRAPGRPRSSGAPTRRSGPRSGRIGAAAAHRPYLPRALRDGPGRRVDAVRRTRPGTLRPLVRSAAHRGPRLHARAGPVAGDDPRPHRG